MLVSLICYCDTYGYVRFESDSEHTPEAVTAPSLLGALHERLRYYLQYKIKDLNDHQIMVFEKGFVLDSKFFMQERKPGHGF